MSKNKLDQISNLTYNSSYKIINLIYFKNLTVFLQHKFEYRLISNLTVRQDPGSHDGPPRPLPPEGGEVPNGRSLPDPGDQ